MVVEVAMSIVVVVGAVGTDRSVYDLISNGSQSHVNNIGQVAVIILFQFRR